MKTTAQTTPASPTGASLADSIPQGGIEAIQPGGPLVVIYAADLEAAEGRVREAGGKIVGPLHVFPGGRRFHFLDPNGNQLAVWTDQPPPA